MIESIFKYIFCKHLDILIFFFKDNLKTLLPLTFAIYFFSYKEQKDVAISLFKTKNWLIRLLITNVTFMLVLSVYASEKKIINSNQYVAFFWLFLIVTYVILFYLFIKETINNINIQKTFDNSMLSIEKDFKIIYEQFNKYKLEKEKRKSINFNKYQKKIVKRVNRIISNSEIAFQIILSKKKYNLSDEFSESLEQIQRTLTKNIEKINKDDEYFSFILPFSINKYSKLHSIVNHGIIDLLKSTMDAYGNKESKILINCFQEVKPLNFAPDLEVKQMYKYWTVEKKIDKDLDLIDQFKHLHDDYIVSTYRVINLLFKNNDNQSNKVLSETVNYAKETAINSNGNDLITLLTALVINAVEKNDLKQLTDVMNILFDYLKEQKKELINVVSTEINIEKIKNRTKLAKSIKTFDEIEEKMHKLLILVIVKSIELGRYNLTGFLVKNVIKNFDSRLLERIINNISTKNSISPKLNLSKRLTELLSINLKFSEASFDYCFHKAVLLLYYQEKFTSEYYKINHIQQKDMINPQRIINNENVINYLNDKIRGLNKEFGLLFLSEEKFECIRIN